ncbi:SsgA family sporulation/cell division regulator [Streptomyces sp. NPDC003753]|uniref:SsgA family sporulation/cell division regulator n=1 Tax=unclassified Streptomyces TaxID=2593676 RepID=UPI001903E6BA|nr:SsgA family sporulation/cell division regulator [Streptomyces sp. Y2F8-2]GHK03953.1 sporulation-specific cell division protein SsgB [Streptomyces sp. Y2F8-2]
MRHPLPGTEDERSVVHRTEMIVSVADEPPIPLPAELRYDMSDPYAVRLSLGAPGVPSVDWVFARSLLADGVRRSAGIGEVVVIPPHRCHPDTLRILLRTRTGAAVLEAGIRAVTAFLRRADTMVPPGTEHRHIDLDGVVARLTAGSE